MAVLDLSQCTPPGLDGASRKRQGTWAIMVMRQPCGGLAAYAQELPRPGTQLVHDRTSGS
jgi:hypothetical protein